MKHLFITGTYRSGTTLLEKILHNHPQCMVASQPFPNLLFEVKRAYNKLRAIPDIPYPVNDGLLKRAFDPNDWIDFLEQTNLERNEILSWIESMKTYSGCLTPSIFNYAEHFEGGSFQKTLQQLYAIAGSILKKETAVYTGIKEIMAEDYVPFLLKNGVKVILIIRDPRDIVTSANYSARKSYVGQPGL